ncbi:hypothetical protein NDU88_004611 [Pleurodeles waltl]|uniref:Uncharacterized protein n=1 Tax=Pleurodeles waltl TaxID=8319 RepID=A0AAV7UG76_PLEWA|nr:hypothetical protein NDU88_004611 [Pleurodeles waltl]
MASLIKCFQRVLRNSPVSVKGSAEDIQCSIGFIKVAEIRRADATCGCRHDTSSWASVEPGRPDLTVLVEKGLAPKRAEKYNYCWKTFQRALSDMSAECEFCDIPASQEPNGGRRQEGPQGALAAQRSDVLDSRPGMRREQLLSTIQLAMQGGGRQMQ